MIRKVSTFIAMTFVILLLSMSQSMSAEVKHITQLDEIAQIAEQQNLPIMISFVAEWCPYCKILEEDMLKPMVISGDYDGKVIIAMPSTSRDEKKSRIVSHLSPGAGVAITRADIEYVITEYGIAYLHGATLRERVLAMIEIAHPKFRKALLEKAKEYGYCYQDQIYNDPPEIMQYPLDCQEYYTLKNGPRPGLEFMVFARPPRQSWCGWKMN